MTEILQCRRSMRQALLDARRCGDTIGFVPTMGSLHAGHRSLVERARRECSKVVASIFVNPKQFDRAEDLASYPRDLEGDRALLEKAGCDWLFTIDEESMYPPGFDSWVEVGGLGEQLCGASRPGHFRGVTTVVAKLFSIVQPTRAYFGEKDFQQLAILEKMTQDLDFPVSIVPCPTVREPDGLALSSRNRLLRLEDRRGAVAIPRALAEACQSYRGGSRDAEAVLEVLSGRLAEAGGRIDYVEAVDMLTLETKSELDNATVIALAVGFGAVRLIDNHRVSRPFPEIVDGG